jgi:hypothetical protein
MAGLTNKDPSCYWCGFTGLCFHPANQKPDHTYSWCNGKCEKYIKCLYGEERQTSGQSH